MPIVWFRRLKGMLHQTFLTFPLVGDVTLRQFAFLSASTFFIIQLYNNWNLYPWPTRIFLLAAIIILVAFSRWPIKTFTIEEAIINILTVKPEKQLENLNEEVIEVSVLGRPFLISRRASKRDINVEVFIIEGPGVRRRVSVTHVGRDAVYSFWFTPSAYGEYRIEAVDVDTDETVDSFKLIVKGSE